MGYLTDFLQHLAKRKATISELPVPWDSERIGIYGFLQQRLAKSADTQPFKDVDLPDEEQFYAGDSVRWAAGARDGVLGHHSTPSDDNGAKVLFTCLKRVLASPTARNFENLYARMLQHSAFATADQIAQLSNDSTIDPSRLSALAERIVRESPDREPVKLAIVLLGIFSDVTHRDLLFTLGQHDEFTLYAAIALARIVPGNERDAVWWALAKSVGGWGRIHIVERLADTTDPDIKAWLLREGYRNTIMNEYLAYACAKDSNLVAALRKNSIDEALLRGAGDILQALANGGPAENMEAYDEGAEACLLYVKHVSEMPSADIECCLPLRAIKAFIDDNDRDWTVAASKGWTPAARQEVSVAINRILGRQEWLPKVKQGLSDEDDGRFESAAIAAQLFGIDPWPYRFERQKAGKSDDWHALMFSDDSERIDLVLDLAHEQLDLISLASGPALEIVGWPEFRQHHRLDGILFGLEAFPGKGWPFINAGLQSPVMSNRQNALNVLSAWGRSQWPEETEFALFRALSLEPDEDIKRKIRQVLDDHPLE